MKKLISIISILLVSNSLSAQAWQGAGDQKIQAGFNAWGEGVGITATYDYALTHIISVGGGANFYFDKKDNDNAFIFGRVAAHLQDPLNLPSQWDIYPGLNLGVLGGEFDLGAYVGVRYFFYESWGAYLEAGNNGSIGVSYSF